MAKWRDWEWRCGGTCPEGTGWCRFPCQNLCLQPNSLWWECPSDGHTAPPLCAQDLEQCLYVLAHAQKTCKARLSLRRNYWHSHLSRFLFQVSIQSEVYFLSLPPYVCHTTHPFAQLFPEPCFWQKCALSPYLHFPDLAALAMVWEMTLGSISISTARAVRSTGKITWLSVLSFEALHNRHANLGALANKR